MDISVKINVFIHFVIRYNTLEFGKFDEILVCTDRYRWYINKA